MFCVYSPELRVICCSERFIFLGRPKAFTEKIRHGDSNKSDNYPQRPKACMYNNINNMVVLERATISYVRHGHCFQSNFQLSPVIRYHFLLLFHKKFQPEKAGNTKELRDGEKQQVKAVWMLVLTKE